MNPRLLSSKKIRAKVSKLAFIYYFKALISFIWYFKYCSYVSVFYSGIP